MFKIFIFAIFIFLSLTSFSQQKEFVENKDFINNHLSKKNINFLLVAEHHFLESSTELKLQLIKALTKFNNTRNIVSEIGEIEAWLCNEFLKTGDTSLLQNTISYEYSDVKMYWQSLFQLQNKLQKREKLKIIGVDFERPGPLKTLVSLLFPEEINNSNVASMINDIKNFKKDDFSIYKRRKFYKLLKKFGKSLLSNKNAYLTYMSQEEYLKLIKSINNPINKPGNFKDRNELMYLNLNSNTELLDGNCFAQFGNAHVRNREGIFAHYLKNDEKSNFKGRVRIVDKYYIDCSYKGKAVNLLYSDDYDAFFLQFDFAHLNRGYYWLNADTLIETDYIVVVVSKSDLN